MYTYPLLQRVSELYEEVELGNVLLLACQHLLEPQLRMFEHLLQMGLKPENCVIVGKNYSTNTEVMQELKAKGCVVAPFSQKFDPMQPFDIWFEERLIAFVKAEISKHQIEKYSKVVILDDGGFMHLVVNELCKDFTTLIGVEQTSSGHHKIQSANIQFPSISVARSYQKLMFESPYIGINGHEKIMQHLRMRQKNNPKVLVIGLGPIGRQLAGQLLICEKFDGYAVDPKLDELRHRGMGSRGVFDLLRPEHILQPCELKQRLKEFDLIVGTTGSPVLTNEDIENLHPEVSLVSISSSDREFPAVPFRHHKGTLHQDYVLGARTLVNGGFPITFDGLRHGMPPQQIELTIALLIIRLLDGIDNQLQHLPSVVEQIRLMWQPDEGVNNWYKKP
ncbi:MAG: hypothetical protein WCO12_00465 [bacterium]